jgi:hypothetical protein
MNIYEILTVIINLLIPTLAAVLGWQVGVKSKENRDMTDNQKMEQVEQLKIGIQKIDAALEKLPEGIERNLQIRNRAFIMAQIIKLVPLHEIMDLVLLDTPQ